MATISENLQTLNEAKQAIKTAIENKGQDLTDVPFTQYAEKIEAITVSDADILTMQKWIDRNRYVDLLFTDQVVAPNQMSPSSPDYKPWTNEEVAEYISRLDFSRVERFNDVFNNLKKVTKVPWFDTSSATDLNGLYRSSAVEEIPLIDTSNATVCSGMHFYNPAKIIPPYDFRSCTNFSGTFSYCSKVQEIWVRNIKANLQVASGSSWGHLLTVESLIHLIKELRDTGSLKTLTAGNINLEKLAYVYVRTIEITDEMRAEDDLIDEKLPFELCESTDEGAMLITDYVAFKNWTIA